MRLTANVKSNFKKRPTEENWINYKDLRNRANHQKTYEQERHFSVLAESNDHKRIWRELKFFNILNQYQQNATSVECGRS